METKRSPLVLETFVVTHSSCQFIPFTSEDISSPLEASQIQESYPVDVEFDILVNEKAGVYSVPVSVSVNQDAKPGYAVRVQGTCFFSLGSELSEKQKADLLLGSGVAIGISSLRAYVANLTAYYPMGRYVFHSVDMVDLISRSQKEEDEKVNRTKK